MQNWKYWSQKTWVIVLAGLLAPPIGMVLAWLKPEWTNRTKWIATGLMAYVLFTMYRSSVVSAEFAAAEQLWSEGKVSEAVEIYRDILGSPAMDREEKEIAYQRTIDYDCEQNNEASAKVLIQKSIDSGLSLSLTHVFARHMYEIEVADRKKPSSEAGTKQKTSDTASRTEKKLPTVSRSWWGPTELPPKKRYILADDPDACKGKEYKMEVKYEGGGSRNLNGDLEQATVLVWTDGNFLELDLAFPEDVKQPNISPGDYLDVSFVFGGSLKSLYSDTPNIVTKVSRP